MRKGTEAHDIDAMPDLAVLRAEWSRLQQEHRELKTRLSELNGRLYLSRDEELERKKIQKLKLAKKDRMAQLDSFLQH